LEAASAKSLRFAAAVVDAGGELVCMARMDGASALNARMSVNKAYTAANPDKRVIRLGIGEGHLGPQHFEVGDRACVELVLGVSSGYAFGRSALGGRAPASSLRSDVSTRFQAGGVSCQDC